MATYVSFLRAINVGGTCKIKMAELKDLYEGLGCADVNTILQTGNVIFKAGKVPKLADSIEGRFGNRPEVIVRNLTDIEKIIAAKPFARFKNLNPSWQIVMFMTSEPDPKTVKSIATENEEIWAKGKEIYIAFPKGIGKSKLSNQKIEKSVGILGTMRNWNTLEKIIASLEKS